MMRKPLYSPAQVPVAGGWKFGMMAGWQEPADRVASSMHTPSPAFGPGPPYRVYLVIRSRGWSPWFGGEKTVCGACGTVHRGWYDRARRRVRDLPCGPYRIYLDLEVRRVACRLCGKVKRERLEFLLENALHTERFARYVGRRCRTGTIKDIAKEMNLDWQTVKRLEIRRMRAQLERAPSPVRRRWGSTRSPSARVTSIASWSATCIGSARSGSAGKIAPSRAWTSSTGFSGKRTPARCVLR